MDNALAVCSYYPTTAVFVDDNEHHLTQINLDIDFRIPCAYLSDPQDALRYMKKYSRRKPIAHLDTLHREIDNRDRFSESSVWVIDYDMPGTGMNGFDLCAQVKKLATQLETKQPKIILLSGQADEATANDGFNKGYIDRYISKQEFDYGQKVNQTIKELQIEFFKERTTVFFNQLSAQPFFCLNDPEFLTVFEQLCQQHEIVERYILNRSGDFLLLQFDGTPLWLIVITEAEKQNGEKAVYMSSAQKIEGKNTPYYYALVKEPDLVTIQREKMLSFKDYLETVWPPLLS